MKKLLFILFIVFNVSCIKENCVVVDTLSDYNSDKYSSSYSTFNEFCEEEI